MKIKDMEREEQLKKAWKELVKLGCNQKLTEKLFIKIVSGKKCLKEKEE